MGFEDLVLADQELAPAWQLEVSASGTMEVLQFGVRRHQVTARLLV
ncbi:hypothetical protein ANMWB30_06180 [Arthrobacter sp. MWB30]|nr:hypothetical protein ANMWB30_06180 [Arthrobacter sp. MWB30]